MAKSDFVEDLNSQHNGNTATIADHTEPLDGSSASATSPLGDGTGEGRGFDGNDSGLGDKGIIRYLCEAAGTKDLEYGHAISVRIKFWGPTGPNRADIRLMGSSTSQTQLDMVQQQISPGGEGVTNAFNNTAITCHGFHMKAYDFHPKMWYGGWNTNPTYVSSGATSSAYPSNGQWYQMRLDIIPSDENDGRVKAICYRSRDGSSLTGHDEASYEDSNLYMKTEYSRDQAYPAGFLTSSGNWGWGFWGAGMRTGFSISVQGVSSADQRPVIDDFEVRVVDCRTELGL